MIPTMLQCHELSGVISGKKMTKSKTFCAYPFNSIAINTSGRVRPCCNSIPRKNIVTLDNGEQSNIAKHDIEDIWNSKWMQNLRYQLLNDEKPDICARCFREEDSGVTSPRQRYYDTSKYYDNTLSIIPKSNMPLYAVEYADVRFGNKCNLACQMCNPYASNQLTEEFKEQQKLGFTELHQQDDNYEWISSLDKWVENTKVWDNLLKLQNLTEAYILGGEPGILEKFYDYCEELIKSGASKNITLKISTNMTVFTNKMQNIFTQFKCVKINMSIDAIEDAAHYIRYPTRWSKIDRNLHKLNQVALKNPKQIRARFHCTLEVLNASPKHLDAFHEYIKQFKGLYPVPYLNILNHPEHLNIQNLPKELKEDLKECLLKWYNYLHKYSVPEGYDVYANDEHNMYDSVNYLPKYLDVIKYLEKDGKSSIDEMKKYIEFYDKRRGTSIKKHFPKLSKYF